MKTITMNENGIYILYEWSTLKVRNGSWYDINIKIVYDDFSESYTDMLSNWTLLSTGINKEIRSIQASYNIPMNVSFDIIETEYQE